MNAAIFRKGLDGIDKDQPIENFEFDIDKGLKAVKDRLIELQKGYCEGNEKPRIGMGELNDKKIPGAKVKYIKAYSEVDFYYIAYIAKKIPAKHLPQAKTSN
jgi:hypothetical protein